MSVKIRIENYREKRRGNEKTLKAATQLRQYSTEEWIVKAIKEIGKQYPEKEIEVDHDGIIKFSVKCNGQLIYEGDHYDIEEMMKTGTYVFSNELISRIDKIV